MCIHLHSTANEDGALQPSFWLILAYACLGLACRAGGQGPRDKGRRRHPVHGSSGAGRHHARDQLLLQAAGSGRGPRQQVCMNGRQLCSLWIAVSTVAVKQGSQSLKVFESLGLKCCFTSTETVGLFRWGAQDVHHNFPTAPELWKFGENEISFSRPWKSVKTLWGLWKFVNFVVFRALGENYQLISQKLHFPRPNSSSKKKKKKNALQNHKKCTSFQFWLIECVSHQLQ